MIELKEALIGKKNISNARPYSSLYCVANYDDDLDLVGDDVVTIRSKDWITIYILSEKETIKYSEEIEEMSCDIWRVKYTKLSVEDIKKKISNSIWKNDLDKKLCEKVLFTTIKEALIGKHNTKNASKKDRELYLVNPYNEYYEYLHDKYLEYEFSQTGVFIIDDNIIKKMIKTVRKSNRISSYIDVYPLTGFDEKMLSKLENDLQYTNDINDGILDDYGLVKIDINDLL